MPLLQSQPQVNSSIFVWNQHQLRNHATPEYNLSQNIKDALQSEKMNRLIIGNGFRKYMV